MILSFADELTARFFHKGECPKQCGWRSVENVAMRKLRMMNNAQSTTDLKAPPGNQLEKLEDDRKGQWSIRINRQWRVCFRWEDGAPGPSDVEIVDVH
jgi:toxin HigB-1